MRELKALILLVLMGCGADSESVPISPIEVGMTSEDVFQLLGATVGGRRPSGNPIVCENFLQVKGSSRRYIHVFYNDGLVSEVATNQLRPCVV